MRPQGACGGCWFEAPEQKKIARHTSTHTLLNTNILHVTLHCLSLYQNLTKYLSPPNDLKRKNK
jgi:hypothetical protein